MVQESILRGGGRAKYFVHWHVQKSKMATATKHVSPSVSCARDINLGSRSRCVSMMNTMEGL